MLKMREQADRQERIEEENELRYKKELERAR